MPDPRALVSTKPLNRLTLAFENREPLPLEKVSAILSAISKDYHQYYHRDLFVEDIRSGSIFVDLADFASKANDLIDFAIHVGELAGAAAAGYLVLRRSRRRGAKTVLALAELAARTGTETRIFSEGADGETLFVHMTPTMAHSIEEHAAAEEERRPIALPDAHPRDSLLEDFAKSAVVKRLEVHQAGNPLDEGTDGLFEIIRTLVKALRETPDGRVRLNGIVSRLRNEGHEEAARLLAE